MTQGSLFDLIDKGFCFDDDINNIVTMLDAIFQGKEMITKIEKEWGIWPHVPQYGYRLSYYVYFNKPLPDSMFVKLDKVIEYGKVRGIEISLLGYNFSTHTSTGSIYIYSIYNDKRRKLKQRGTSGYEY